MNKFTIGLVILLVTQGVFSFAVTPILSKKELNTPPSRIIRTCCAFGTDLNLVGVPFASINHITSVEKLNEHVYLGDKDEGNGIIYTRKGGFIDIGHLRDQADWTYYLYSLILDNRSNGTFVQKLSYEGGKKVLEINVNNNLDSLDCLHLAAKISYDLSLWHELSTWFGASSMPFIPERYSSFTVEDAYSNLLGANLAIEAIKTNLPYNEAMTKILLTKLDELGVVETEDKTIAAMESVRDVWWTGDKRLPRKSVTIARQTNVFTQIRPWLVEDSLFGANEPVILLIPKRTNRNELFTNYYTLNINLNGKFPVAEIFPNREGKAITQDDFDVLLHRVEEDLMKRKQPVPNLGSADTPEVKAL